MEGRKVPKRFLRKSSAVLLCLVGSKSGPSSSAPNANLKWLTRIEAAELMFQEGSRGAFPENVTAMPSNSAGLATDGVPFVVPQKVLSLVRVSPARWRTR